jgi:hypothetical protein
VLSRRAGSFSPLVIAILAIFITISAIVVTISTVVITALPIVEFVRIIAAHSCLEVTDAFAKTFGDFRYAARAEENDYYQRDDQ